MYAEEPENISSKDKKSGLYGVLVISIFLIIAIFLVTYAIAKIYFPHAECKIDVDLWHKGEFWGMMDYIKRYDPSAYSLICSNVNKVSFGPSSKEGGHFQEILDSYGRKIGTEIFVSTDFWDTDKTPPYPWRAEVLIHEVCHATFSEIRGNFMGMDGCDVEYPCFLRGELLKYKFGYYNETKDPYLSMLGSFEKRKVCGKVLNGYNDYCKRASIRVKEASKGEIIVENNGTTQLHCMMLELSINGVLHPVDCDYIPLGTEVTIYNRYFDGRSNATLRIFGCKDRIRANVK